MIGCSDHYLEIYHGKVEQTYESKMVADSDVAEARWFPINSIQDP